MSDVQDELSTSDDPTSMPRPPFVISFVADDRDWAEWVAGHLDGLGRPNRLLDPALDPGSAALRQVATQRSAGDRVIVIASHALLQAATEPLDLDRIDAAAAPLIVVLIEDVALPAEWGDAVRAPMFEAPDDYHASRRLLLEALDTAFPGAAAPTPAPTPELRRAYPALPEPVVILDPYPVPEPAPSSAPALETGPPGPVRSVFDELPTTAEPLGPAPVAEAAPGLDELPSPATRPGAGLLGLSAAHTIEAAQTGGASVTETERDAEPAGAEPAEIDAEPAVSRLPFGAPVLYWPDGGVLDRLERGLRHRCGEELRPPGGLFARRDADTEVPTGVLVALTGPLGVGTSTLALAHAHRRSSHLDLVWWARGHSTETLRADLRALAVAIGIDATTTDGLLSGLCRHLATTDDQWLLVIDDLADGVHLDGLTPTAGKGQVLVTGRSAPERSFDLAVGAPDPATARQALAAACEAADPDQLGRIADELADQPWALAIAIGLLTGGAEGETIAAGHLADVLDRLHTDGTVGLPARSSADAVVLAAQATLVDADGATAECLTVLSVLAPLPLGRREVDDLCPQLAAMAAPCHLVNVGDDQLAMVPAAAAAIRRMAGHEATGPAASRAAALVGSVLTADAPATVVDRYAPHATALLELADTPATAADVLTALGGAADVAGDWAARLAGHAGDTDQPDQPDQPDQAGNGVEPGHVTDGGPAAAPVTAEVPSEEALAELRRTAHDASAAGNHDRAMQLFEQLVDATAARHGADDLQALSARTELAMATAAAGNRHRANQLLEAIATDTARVSGEDHPATTLAKHNLANSYAELGRHDAALVLRRHVLEARSRTLGDDHPQTVSARSNLANSLSAVGATRDALTLREEVAEVRLRTLGLDNGQTLGALNNLANSYADLERHDEALRVRQQVLEGRERLLGAEHPHTITARNNLANSLAAVGRHDEALAERQRTLADSERVLGPDHPHTITARANLAFTGALPAPAAATTPTGDTPTAGTDAPSTSAAAAPADGAPAGETPAAAAEGTPSPTGEEGPRKKRRFWFFFWRR